MTDGWRYQRNVFHFCLPAIETGLFVVVAERVVAGAIQQIQGGQQIFPCSCDYLLGSLNLLENCLSLIEGTKSTSGTL